MTASYRCASATPQRLRCMGGLQLFMKLIKLLPLLLLLSCSNNVELVRLKGETMGTTYTIKYVKRDKTPSFKEVKAKVDEFLLKFNNSVSTYIKDSTISKFNQSLPGQEIMIDEYMMKSLTTSRQVYKASRGHFDPSIGPLVNLWGFGPNSSKKVPTPEQIKTAKEKVGLSKLAPIRREILNGKESFFITKPVEGFYLDFSAIAKGFAIDIIAEILEHEFFIRDFMIEIGGEIKVKSFKKESWNLAVETPSESSRSVQKIIPIVNGSIATSGNYRNFFESGGKKFGHTINPFTGISERSNLLSATVVADDCWYADAWATGFMALGDEKALDFADKYGIQAYFIVNKDGKLAEVYSKAWKY